MAFPNHMDRRTQSDAHAHHFGLVVCGEKVAYEEATDAEPSEADTIL